MDNVFQKDCRRPLVLAYPLLQVSRSYRHVLFHIHSRQGHLLTAFVFQVSFQIWNTLFSLYQ